MTWNHTVKQKKEHKQTFTYTLKTDEICIYMCDEKLRNILLLYVCTKTIFLNTQ